MKKLISLILSAVMLAATLNLTLFNAWANSLSDSVPIMLNGQYSSTISGTADKYEKSCVYFDCTATGYYDFTVSFANVPDGIANITVYDSTMKVINYASNNFYAMSFTATTMLTQGNRYYFSTEIDGSLNNIISTLSYHNHSYTDLLNVKAVGDDTAELRSDGFVRYICPSCGAFYDTAVYYAPAYIALSKSNFVYDGLEKYPTVAVYDRAGGVIAPTEYSVAYEDNVFPGVAYVTVTFNSAVYDGEMTASFSIVPQKQKITYIKSKKSKTLNIKWVKDYNADGYELQYSTSPKYYKSKTVTVDITKNRAYARKLEKLKGNKKYYVRIRSYKTVNSVKYYGSWSSKSYAKVKK